jgi:DNA-binding LacI/PurR family transcriptional regulator
VNVSRIHDLARLLNISIGTVSRALNGRADVNAETRQRVLAAAAKLNYVPNRSGRNLRRGATHAVAFMLQPHPGDQKYGEPFFIPFLTGLQARLAERGLDLLVLMGAPGDYQQERLRRVVEGGWADAVVLAWTRRSDERIDYLTEVGFPFATLGRSRSGGASYPWLDLDFERAGEEAVDRLVAAGHRRIAAVGQSLGLNFGHLFLAGYRRGLRRHGIQADRRLIAAGNINEAGGYAVTPEVMDGPNPPTAIIFNNDAMAVGGCKALIEMGIQPGRDVAVIVIVDTPLCRYFSPALTSFRPPLEALGSRLAEMLLASMPAYSGEAGVQIIREVWPMELTPRESDSCGPRGFREGQDAAPPPPWWGRALSLSEPKASLEKEGEGVTLTEGTSEIGSRLAGVTPFRPKRLSRFAPSGAKGESPPPLRGRGRPRV